MAILSTIKVKKNPTIQLQECVRLTSNYFLHLAFDYCALRGIQVQTHHQASFHLSCINNFFIVVKYAIDYWSTACFWMYLSSHHSYEEIKYTHSHFTDWELKHRKEKQIMEEHGLEKPNPPFTSGIQSFCCTKIWDPSIITCFQELSL